MSGMRKITNKEYDLMHSYFKKTNQLRNLALLSVLRWTGYRIKEVLSMQVHHVCRPDGEIFEEIHVKPKFMKKKQPRPPVWVHNKLEADLLLWLAELQGDTYQPKLYLFPSRKGENKPISYTQAYRVIKDAADAKNVYERVACHSLRKSFAQSVYEGTGKDIVATQIIIGHASPVSTSHYIGVDQEVLKSAVLNQ